MSGLQKEREEAPGEAPRSTSGEAGDSLEHLYRRHGDWLRRNLWRRFGGALAEAVEDLVQDTYLRAAAVQAKGPIRHPRALLLRIAGRLAVDQLRRDRRAMALAPPMESHDEDQHDLVLLKQIVLSLPEKDREVFVLSRFAGLSYADIAAHLSIPLKTVEWRMSRALVHCAAQLRR